VLASTVSNLRLKNRILIVRQMTDPRRPACHLALGLRPDLSAADPGHPRPGHQPLPLPGLPRRAGAPGATQGRHRANCWSGQGASPCVSVRRAEPADPRAA
jgi:hypothetical protein